MYDVFFDVNDGKYFSGVSCLGVPWWRVPGGFGARVQITDFFAFLCDFGQVFGDIGFR